MYSKTEKRKPLLFIIFIIFQFNFSFLETIELGTEKCNMIIISQRLIFIFQSNNTIYDYTNKLTFEHSSDISRNKFLIKMNENNFAIFGFNINNQFIYQTYEVNNNQIKAFSSIYNLGLSNYNIAQYDIRYLTSYNKFILSINNNVDDVNENFRCYQIEGNALSDYPQPDYKEHSSSYSRDNVQCDSFDGTNIFCIFNWKAGTNDYFLYYGYGTKSNLYEGKICSGCFPGNVISIYDNKIQKYLVCFINSNKYLICKYYYIQDNNLFTESEHEMWRGTDATIINKPLILKNYDYSIFIEIEVSYAGAGGNFGILIMTSFDFNIKITSNIEKGNIYVYDFINDDNNYYALYSDESKYKMKIQKLAQCINTKYIYFSQNEKIDVDFLTDHINEQIIFSLDRNTKLYNKDAIVNNYEYIFYSLSTSDNYNFRMVELNSAINNYYCYAKFSTSTEYDYFSLICGLTIKVCYKSCETCNIDLISSSSEQYCNSCNSEYYPLISEIDNEIGYNCHSKDEIIPYYYYNSATNLYELCDDTCKLCSSKTSCKFCKDNYYFMVDKNDETKILYNKQCFNLENAPISYYVDYNANLKNEDNQLIQTVFKPCYSTCYTCSGKGIQSAQSCIQCSNNLIKYNFNDEQCFMNTELCTNKHIFWKYENYDITCNESCPSPYALITTGKNKGQCVKDCQNYINPYSNETDDDVLYLTLNCTKQIYCIPYSSCTRINFDISKDGKNCIGECSYFDIFLYNDPYEYFESLPPVTDKEIENVDEKKEQIKKRIKITKLLKNDNNIFFDKTENYYKTIIEKYYQILKAELLEYTKASNIYLITSTKYNNYTVTVYPLDIEDFVYEQIFLLNNYGFVNFTNFFPNFLEYEIKEQKIILICTIQFHEQNTSINDINYFVYKFNELCEGNLNLLGNLINITANTDLLEKNDIIDIYYPLYNYYNNTTLINKRNTENLVDNLKNIYEFNPEIQLYNISDPFYNDICVKFKTDVGTDMTLNDRRYEYYINESLCEINCTLYKIIDLNNNPRSLCKCLVKNNTEYNNPKSKKDEIISIFKPNHKSFYCIKESFNSYSSKNPFLWIFIVIIIFQIIIFIFAIKNRKKELKKLFNNPINESDEKIKISEISQDSEEIHNNKVNLNLTINEKKSENNLTVPIKAQNPPKKNEKKKMDMKYKEKDLISGNSSIEIGGKNLNEYTDISFDEIQIGNFINIKKSKNDDKETKNMLLENNYLIDPLAIERELIIKKVYRSLIPLKKEDFKKKYFCGEEILYPEQNEFKPIGHRNKKIIKKLGGQKILAHDLIINNSDDENKPRFPEKKNKKENTSDILFTDLIDDDNAMNKKIKYGNKNNISNNSRNQNNFYNSIANNKNKEEEKNVNNKLKTELNVQDANGEIKKKLAIINKKKRHVKKNNIPIINNNNINENIESKERLKHKRRISNSKNELLINKKEEKNEIEKNEIKSNDIKSNEIKSNEEEEEEEESEDKIRKRRKKNLELLDMKYFSSNFSEKDNKILIQKNFLLLFWDYFSKREIIYLCIINKEKIIPYFIRFLCLTFYIAFHFVMNCLFFFESSIHKRYLNALKGKGNNIAFYFKNEFIYTIYISFIIIIVKILIVKLLLYKLFKIGKKHKKLMSTTSEKNLYKEELKKLKKIRDNYLKCYNLGFFIYSSVICALTILFGYICICYGAIFFNSLNAFFFGFLFSLIFTYIICAILCLLIVCVYKLGKTLNSKCVTSFYIVLSTLY